MAGEIEAPEGWDGWWVAELDGTVIGAAGGRMTASDTGDVLVLYLDPAFRRRGAGTLLLEAVTGEQRARGATAQTVSVTEGNDKGIPFYKARGFQISERRPAYDQALHPGGVDLVMRRDLAAVVSRR